MPETQKPTVLDKLRGRQAAHGQAAGDAFLDSADRAATNTVMDIRLDDLVPNPDQPRQHFDESEIAHLAASIENDGLIQPISVFPAEDDGKYVIVAGERRFRAAQHAGHETIRAILSPKGDLKRLALIENIQRVDLHPVETAQALAEMKEQEQWNETQLAEIMGKSQQLVNELLIINKLPKKIKRAYLRADPGRVSRSAMVEVARASDDSQLELWRMAKKGATVAHVREKKAELQGGARTRAPIPDIDKAVAILRRVHKQVTALAPESLQENAEKVNEARALLAAMQEQLAAVAGEQEGNLPDVR